MDKQAFEAWLLLNGFISKHEMFKKVWVHAYEQLTIEIVFIKRYVIIDLFYEAPTKVMTHDSVTRAVKDDFTEAKEFIIRQIL